MSTAHAGGRFTAAAAGLCLLVHAGSAAATELWSDATGARSYSLDASIKWTSALSRASSDTVLYPQEWSAASLWRFRAVADARPTPWLTAQVAYEQRARSLSEGAGAGGATGALPTHAAAPYRVRQLDGSIVDVGESFSLRHELDRAFAAVSLGGAEITVGRQAVGWVRAVYFSAVDVFAPFSPLESDREWRRGIDAVRVSVPLTDLISLDAVAAFGESLDGSAFLGRVHGYIGDVDGEVIAGRRCEDELYAASASLPVLDAELHGELALFRTPTAFPSGAFGTDAFVTKASVGGSYSFDVAAGLLVMGEYHYSGFGFANIADAGDGLSDSGFLDRYLRGDTQILGRHAAAVQVASGFGTVFPASVVWVFSPADGSGVVIPTGTWGQRKRPVPDGEPAFPASDSGCQCRWLLVSCPRKPYV